MADALNVRHSSPVFLCAALMTAARGPEAVDIPLIRAFVIQLSRRWRSSLAWRGVIGWNHARPEIVHRRQMARRRGRQDPLRSEPRNRPGDRHARACREGRSRRGRCGRRQGLSRPGARFRPSSARKIMRKAADILRSRADDIAQQLTQEQGKPLVESKGEVMAGADIIDWFAEEAQRTYGRVIPARSEGVYQLVVKEPVGPVAAFTPWNFPINSGGAETVGGARRRLLDHPQRPRGNAGLDRRAGPRLRRCRHAGRRRCNLVFGMPAEISEFLMPHPVIRKISFTGSTAVGKQLASLAGAAHEARHHGARRPCARDRVRGCRYRSRHQAAAADSSTAMPARSAARRRASWCRRRSTTISWNLFVALRRP